MGRSLPVYQLVELGGKLFYVIHDIGMIDVNLESMELMQLYTGIPMFQKRKKRGVLYLILGVCQKI